MLLNSIPFILFFPIVVLLYYLIPVKFRYIWLLACSYFFYMTQSTSFVALLLLSTFTTYIAGILLSKLDGRAARNSVVAITFIINLGILFSLKYTDFIMQELGSGVRFNLILPIGISFYTFQALSYVMDSYRKKIEPEYNFFRYALYVSFFLSILSGPINRACDFLPELRCGSKLELDNVKQGLQKMLWGYFLKLVIAGRITILVDLVYGNPNDFSGGSLLIAATGFLFMLYCDFEGYSCIAIGAAKILGITMKENFMQPFYSTSMSQLWKRWHISLSTWLREYLYFPLGGNRKGTARKYMNLMIVMIVSGLWHGANYTFMIWGFLNGLFLIMGNALLDTRNKLADKTGLSKVPGVRTVMQRIGVYVLYGFTMIFFANDSVAVAMDVIRGIFTRFSIGRLLSGEIFSLGLGTMNLGLVILLAVFVLVVDGYCNRKKCDICGLFKNIPNVFRWAMYLALVTLIMFSANLTGTEFIYSKM